MKSSKKACKIFAESKLLSAVTVLTRDKNSDFSKIKCLIINKLIFKKRHWKVPLSPPEKSNAMSVAFFVCTILVRADDHSVLLVDELVHFGAYLFDCGFVFLMSAAAIVVRSRKKNEYLESLHATDQVVGFAPSDGAHASIQEIENFLKYFNHLVADEVWGDYLFVTERNEDYWWYDGEMVRFRSPNYAKMLRIMRTMPSVTQKELHEELGISITAIQKLINQLVAKNYIEKNLTDGSWRVIISPSL